MPRILKPLILLLFSSPALAYIECTYISKQVMMDNTGNSVWMCFDEGLCIKAYKDQVGEKVIDRTFSKGMAAILGNGNCECTLMQMTLIVTQHQETIVITL